MWCRLWFRFWFRFGFGHGFGLGFGVGVCYVFGFGVDFSCDFDSALVRFRLLYEFSPPPYHPQGGRICITWMSQPYARTQLSGLVALCPSAFAAARSKAIHLAHSGHRQVKGPVPRRRAGVCGSREMIFTWEDASLIPQEQNVDAEAARKRLQGVLEMTKHHSWESYDMTNTHANWRASFGA